MAKHSVKLLFLTIFICIILSQASAQLLVKISPRDSPKEISTFYADEIISYRINVFNSGTNSVNPILFKIVVGSELAILDEGREKPEKYFRIESIDSGATKFFDLDFKGKKTSKENIAISVFFGPEDRNNENFSQAVSTFARVEKNPVSINASLKNFVIDIGGNGIVVFNMKNGFQSELSNVSIGLLAGKQIDVLTKKIELEKMPAGSKLKEKEFDFALDPAFSGNIPVVLSVSYTDINGFHSIEKRMNAIVESQKLINSIFIVIILALILLLAFMLRKKPEEKKK